jgi:hypothetical protein
MEREPHPASLAATSISCSLSASEPPAVPAGFNGSPQTTLVRNNTSEPTRRKFRS